MPTINSIKNIVWFHENLNIYNIKCVFPWLGCLYCCIGNVWFSLHMIEEPVRGSAGRTVFPHRAKSNICFVLHFFPTSRWPRMISWALSTFSAWMRAIWGTVISAHSISVYYFSKCGLQLGTQLLKILVSCVKCPVTHINAWEKKKKTFALNGVKLGCPANCLDSDLCYLFTCTWKWR